VAYDLTQKRLIAREVARAGGSVAAAVRACREHTESLRGLGERTVRRYLGQQTFQRLLEEQRKVLDAAAAEATAEHERRKMLSDLQGSLVERQMVDEQIADELRDDILRALKADDDAEAPAMSINQKAQLLDKLNRILDRRRERTLPAMAGFKEGALLVAAMQETLQREVPERAAAIVDRIRARYREKQEAEQTDNGSNP
jgi:hypothetical protein